MLDHQGHALAETAELFAEPPAALGTIQSAYTKLYTTDKPSWWSMLWGKKIPLTYVGTTGLARFFLSGGRGGAVRSEQISFDDVDYLRINVERHKSQSAYAQNVYEYRWHDRRDLGRFTIRGYLHDRPPPADEYHFAVAAARSWNVYRTARYREELKRDGIIRFPLIGNQMIRMADGFIDLIGFKADVVRISRQELESIMLTEGKFLIKHKDATWWGRGKFTVDYNAVGNPDQFITFLAELMPIPQS